MLIDPIIGAVQELLRRKETNVRLKEMTSIHSGSMNDGVGGIWILVFFSILTKVDCPITTNLSNLAYLWLR